MLHFPQWQNYNDFAKTYEEFTNGDGKDITIL